MKKEQTLLLEMENTKAKFKNSADIFSSRLDLKKKCKHERTDQKKPSIHALRKKEDTEKKKLQKKKIKKHGKQ